MTKILSEREIIEGAAIIKAGGTVAFRTETVYGLGADSTNADAVLKIFAAKGRPAVNPLIVHFACVKDIFSFFSDIDPISRRVLRKIKTALTVVLPKNERIPAVVCGGLDTVAVRVPACRFARKFIKACGTPIAAPSANTSTRPSPTRWQDVRDDLDGKIDAVFAGKPTKIGVESTVIKVANGKILVLRLGGYNSARLAKKTGICVEFATKRENLDASPGTRFRHYAPSCPVYLIRNPEKAADFISGKKAVVLDFRKSGRQAARDLFSSLREAEKTADVILIKALPDTPEFEAVNERIMKACEGKEI